jgi:hypothetical protein
MGPVIALQVWQRSTTYLNDAFVVARLVMPTLRSESSLIVGYSWII